MFAAQDAITKSLTTSLPVGQIVFVRFTAFLLFALAFAARGPGVRAALRSAVPRTQVLRCTLMCSEIALFAWALRHLGIAEIHALFACFPLVVAALSAPLLGERVGPLRWTAVGVGLVGTLVILRPGTDVFDPHALAPLACAVIYALYNLLTRQVSRRDGFATSLVYFGLVGTLASAGFAALQWQPVDGARRAAARGAVHHLGGRAHDADQGPAADRGGRAAAVPLPGAALGDGDRGGVLRRDARGDDARGRRPRGRQAGVFVGWREYLATKRQPRQSTSASATPSIRRS